MHAMNWEALYRSLPTRSAPVSFTQARGTISGVAIWVHIPSRIEAYRKSCILCAAVISACL